MNHSSNIFIIVLLTVFLLTVPCGGNAGDTYQELINCDLHQGACAQILSEVTVTLDVTPKPIKAMQALLFKVTLTGNPPPHAKAAHIDLGGCCSNPSGAEFMRARVLSSDVPVAAERGAPR
jgi:hypothetical protein